jgi:hypothetical protein
MSWGVIVGRLSCGAPWGLIGQIGKSIMWHLPPTTSHAAAAAAAAAQVEELTGQVEQLTAQLNALLSDKSGLESRAGVLENVLAVREKQLEAAGRGEAIDFKASSVRRPRSRRTSLPAAELLFMCRTGWGMACLGLAVWQLLGSAGLSATVWGTVEGPGPGECSRGSLVCLGAAEAEAEAGEVGRGRPAGLAPNGPPWG